MERPKSELMTGPEEDTLPNLINSFVLAPAGAVDEAYQRLVDALWRSAVPTELAMPAIPHLVASLTQVDELRQGRVSILLGLLAEAENPAVGAPLNAAVRAGLDRYLELWRHTPENKSLSLGLQYLVAHFPEDRDLVLATADEIGLADDDRARLDRALLRFDPDDREPDVGHVYPYPAAWEMDESERMDHRTRTGALSADQIETQWHKDTSTVLGFTGARAYWAVVNDAAPAPVDRESLAPLHPQPRDADVELFRRHEAALRCPGCGGGLTFEDRFAQCVACAERYPITKGMLNFSAPDGSDFLSELMNVSTMSHFYEATARPNFTRLCGFTWDGAVSPAFEAELIAEMVRPVEGPVLDLCAGAGGFTAALVEAVGDDRVIALDMMPTMLASLRHRLPTVPAVVTNARVLPFDDDSLGAVMCWNGPQALVYEDTPQVFAEIGRCLRPGGTFTTYSFRNAEDPIYRHFVAAHYLPQAENGLEMYDLGEFKEWLEQAGLVVREESTVGLAFFINAEKRTSGRSAPADPDAPIAGS